MYTHKNVFQFYIYNYYVSLWVSDQAECFIIIVVIITITIDVATAAVIVNIEASRIMAIDPWLDA